MGGFRFGTEAYLQKHKNAASAVALAALEKSFFLIGEANSIGVFHRAVLVNPEHVYAANTVCQSKSIFVGHTGQRRRKCVRQASVRGENRNGGKIIGGHLCCRIYDVMILAVS